jgi:hypothetical protein
MCVSIWYKFDQEKVKKQFIERSLKFPRLRQRLVQRMGSYFWQKIPEAEFEKMLDKLVIDLRDRRMENQEDLAEFVSHESQIKYPLDLP